MGACHILAYLSHRFNQKLQSYIYLWYWQLLPDWTRLLLLMSSVGEGRVSYYFCCCTVGKHVEFIWSDLIWLVCRAWFNVQWFNCPFVGRTQQTTANIEWVVVVWLLNSQTNANQSFTLLWLCLREPCLIACSGVFKPRSTTIVCNDAWRLYRL